MKKHIPNILTILRIILVPIFIYFVFLNDSSNHVLWATIVFIIASITDYFDGMLARKFKVISNFGKIMDPLADKILVASALFALAFKPIDFISIYIVIIIIFREIIITILRDYYARKKVFIAANIWGKLKTILQMVGIIFALIFYSMKKFLHLESSQESFVVSSINIFFWGVALVTVLSGLNYFFVKHKK
ncbi:MAG: CDP-diacylglycerol--glycerol-3-phosphate 3-phosphatidyltransferase [Candidatus Cloacimonetes bacterium]|nr:CDP-diacylglycerol--glycerol-3-phosphate 3-phosphatidyltransferase [Candidatus Cloacimonadota bacterium]